MYIDYNTYHYMEVFEDMTLNEEESKMIADNVKLIGGYSRDRNIDLDKYYDLLLNSLIKSVKAYDKNRGELSTLFYTVARNDLYNEFLREERLKDHNLIGISDSAEEQFINRDYKTDNYFLDDLSNFNLDILTDRELKVIKMLTKDYTFRDIADKLGYNVRTIYRDRDKIRVKLNDCYVKLVK